MNVYFDNAATTKVRDEVIDNMSNVLKDCYGNPSSTHSYGRSAKSYIETARKSIAKILNCDPGKLRLQRWKLQLISLKFEFVRVGTHLP